MVQQKKRKRNLLVFAVSTLPDRMGEATYGIIEGTEKIVKGRYLGQLEPVYRYMLEEYPGEDYHVVMLCTEDTQKQHEIHQKSAVEFYEETLKEIRKEKSSESDLKIVTIRLDENAPFQAVAETIGVLKDHTDSRLWIDTHGSFREVTLVMEAVISLADVYGIHPDHVYGVQYNYKNTPASLIVPQENSYGIFDFVSGMNEFINRGDTTMLNRYYRQHPDPEVEPVLRAMNRIADATRGVVR